MARSSRSSNGGEKPDTGDPKTLRPEESTDLTTEYGPERIPGTYGTDTYRETLQPEESTDLTTEYGPERIPGTYGSDTYRETHQPEKSSEAALPPASEAQPIDVMKHLGRYSGLAQGGRFGNPDELSQEVVKAFNEGYLKLADAIESYTHGLEFAARYFEAVGGTMSAWQEEIYDKRNLVRTPQATNDFQPYVKWAHGDNPDASGMISRLAYALDVWAEYPDGKRPSPVVNEGETESAFITWLNSHGGYHGLYSGRGESRGRYVDPGDFAVYKLKITGAKPDETRFRVYLTGGEDLGAFEDHYPEAIAEVARELPEFAGHTPTIDHPAVYLREDDAAPLVKAFTDLGCALVESEMSSSPEPVIRERIRAQAAQSGGTATTTAPSPVASTPLPRRTAAAPTGRGRGRPAGGRGSSGSTPTPKGKNTRVWNALTTLMNNHEVTQIIIDDASKQALEQAEKIMLRLREIADDIEVELNKIDEKVARAETRKKSVRRKAA
jgi:hypothetical protein